MITKPGYKPVSVNVSHHLSAEGGAAFLGNAVIGGALGATVDIVTGATEDLAPNNMTLMLEREALAPWGTAVQSYTTNRMWSQYDPPAPSVQEAANNYPPALDALAVQPSRTVEIKVLPNGNVEDVRETQ